jgi:hypothetical protein
VTAWRFWLTDGLSFGAGLSLLSSRSECRIGGPMIVRGNEVEGRAEGPDSLRNIDAHSTEER